MTTSLIRARSPFDSLTVGDAMHHGIVTCDPSASLHDVVTILAENEIHSVVVADASGEGDTARLWGFVSDIDLVRGLTSPVTLTAGNLAVLEVVKVAPDDRLEHAAQLMGEHDLAHVIVVDDGRPAGVLSTLDVARAVSRTPDAAVR